MFLSRLRLDFVGKYTYTAELLTVLRFFELHISIL